jgi:hypothetical protein
MRRCIIVPVFLVVWGGLPGSFRTLVQAQQADEPAATFDGPPAVAWIDPGAFVPEPLARPIDVDFRDIPLVVAMQTIGESVGMPVLIDYEALSDQGLDELSPVTVNTVQTPAYQVLDRMLDAVQGVPLAWRVREGMLWITTKEIADDTLMQQSHAVSDLLAAGFPMNGIIEAIQNQTEGPWFRLDGIGGEISSFGDEVMVRQTDRVQREVAALLAALRAEGLERRIISADVDARIESALGQPYRAEFDDRALVDVVASINEQTGTDLHLDEQALSDAGIDGDTGITITLPELPLGVALDYILESVAGVPCALTRQDGRLLVTTREVAQDEHESVVYDLRDVIGNDPSAPPQLVGILYTQTTGPWFHVDGIGGTVEFPVPWLAIVRQHAACQAEVRNLIGDLRVTAARVGRDGAPDAANVFDPQLEVRLYQLDTETVDDLLRTLPDLVAPGTWASTLTPGGEVLPLNPGGVGTLRKIANGRRVVHVPEPPTQEADAADNGEDVIDDPAAPDVLVIPQATLIIRQHRHVHVQIADELRKIVGSPRADFISSGQVYQFQTQGDFGFGGGFY